MANGLNMSLPTYRFCGMLRKNQVEPSHCQQCGVLPFWLESRDGLQQGVSCRRKIYSFVEIGVDLSMYTNWIMR